MVVGEERLIKGNIELAGCYGSPLFDESRGKRKTVVKLLQRKGYGKGMNKYLSLQRIEPY